jgi:Na+-driven multidrug efflux pump
MGIMGAAWATVISQAIAAWVLASVFTETKIAFKMSTKAILNSLLIYPVLKSLKRIMDEAVK